MQKYEYNTAHGVVLYENEKYLVVQLPEPVIVNAGMNAHLWNYAVVNKLNGIREAHADAFPNAVALCFQLTGMHEKADEEIKKEADSKAREKARANRGRQSGEATSVH